MHRAHVHKTRTAHIQIGSQPPTLTPKHSQTAPLSRLTSRISQRQQQAAAAAATRPCRCCGNARGCAAAALAAGLARARAASEHGPAPAAKPRSLAGWVHAARIGKKTLLGLAQLEGSPVILAEAAGSQAGGDGTAVTVCVPRAVQRGAAGGNTTCAGGWALGGARPAAGSAALASASQRKCTVRAAASSPRPVALQAV